MLGCCYHNVAITSDIIALPPSVRSTGIGKAVLGDPTEEMTNSSIFEATLTNDTGEALGWHLDLMDRRLIYVSSVSSSPDTPIARYNASVPEWRRIQAGDYILEVNGERSNSDTMGLAIRSHAVLTLHLTRPWLFTRTVIKKGRELGLDIKQGESGTSLLIEAIRTSGAVKKCAPEVQPMDRVVAVNGIRGSNSDLVQAIKKTDLIEVVLSRVALSPYGTEVAQTVISKVPK